MGRGGMWTRRDVHSTQMCPYTPTQPFMRSPGQVAGVVPPPFTYTFFLYANFTLPDFLVNTILPPPCHSHPPYPTKSWPPSLSMFLPSICLSNFPLTYDMLILKMLAEFDETEIKAQQKKNQMLNKSSTLKKKKIRASSVILTSGTFFP